MDARKSINVTLRISGVPEEKLDSIRKKVILFRNDIQPIIKDIEQTDTVYYDFNVTDSEWIDTE